MAADSATVFAEAVLVGAASTCESPVAACADKLQTDTKKISNVSLVGGWKGGQMDGRFNERSGTKVYERKTFLSGD